MTSPRISVSLALDSLAEQCDALREAEHRVVIERQIRDNLIRDARASDIAYRRISRLTGLSRVTLGKIVDAPYWVVDPTSTRVPTQ